MVFDPLLWPKTVFWIPYILHLSHFTWFWCFWQSMRLGQQVLTKVYHNFFSQKIYFLTFKMPCRPSSYDVSSRKYYFSKLGDFSYFLLFLVIFILKCMFCCQKEPKITKNTKTHQTLKYNISMMKHRKRTVDTAF